MAQGLWDSFGSDWKANLRLWERSLDAAIPKVPGTWKESATANPAFLRRGTDLLLYYRGTGPVEGDPEARDQIGVARVIELGVSGVKLDAGGRLAVPSGGPLGFDCEALDPSPVEFDGKVLLYYSALGPDEDSVGCATSGNGMHFERSRRIMPGRAPCAVVKDGLVYLLNQELSEGGGYGLTLWKSSDGVHFEPVQGKDRFVFGPADSGWDSLSVVTARVWRHGEWFTMTYGGSSEKVDEPAYFGLARSRDLVHWERHPGNPIFGAGMRGAADGECIWFPAIFETSDGFVLLYEGATGTQAWNSDSSICLAFLPHAPE